MLRRARGFIEDAEFDLERRKFDLAVFHLEQAAQLMVKAKLLDMIGYYRRTHMLRELLSDLAGIWKGNEVRGFVQAHKQELRDMERAYITARYIYEDFFEEEVKRALSAVKELEVLLWKE